MPIRLPVVLSPSRTELCLRCYRRHALSDICDRRLSNSPSAAFGGVLHKGAGAWWLTSDASLASDAAVAEWNKTRPSGNNHTKGMAESLIEGYTKKASLSADFPGTWKIASLDGEPMIEKRVELPLTLDGGVDAVLSFQLDRMLVDDKGNILVPDLKSAARLDNRWRRQWQMSLQMKLYRYGVLQLCPEAKNVYIVIEGVEKSLPYKQEYVLCPEWNDELLEEAFRAFSQSALRDHALLTPSLDRRDVELRALSSDFNYGDCWAYFQPCPYMPICIRPPSQRIQKLETYPIIEIEGY